MSERKVLNVSTNLLCMRRTCLIMNSLHTDLQNVVIMFTEILSSGLRSIEDPSYETGQEPSVYRTTHGPLQYAMRHLRRIHLQREEVQCQEGRCRERGLPRYQNLQILYKSKPFNLI